MSLMLDEHRQYLSDRIRTSLFRRAIGAVIEPVDVVVADQISHFGIGGGMPEIYNDARRRLLKRGGRTIPRRVELFAAPVNFPAMWQVVSFWDKKPAGLNMDPAHVTAFNTGYPT